MLRRAYTEDAIDDDDDDGEKVDSDEAHLYLHSVLWQRSGLEEGVGRRRGLMPPPLVVLPQLLVVLRDPLHHLDKEVKDVDNATTSIVIGHIDDGVRLHTTTIVIGHIDDGVPAKTHTFLVLYKAIHPSGSH